MRRNLAGNVGLKTQVLKYTLWSTMCPTPHHILWLCFPWFLMSGLMQVTGSVARRHSILGSHHYEWGNMYTCVIYSYPAHATSHCAFDRRSHARDQSCLLYKVCSRNITLYGIPCKGLSVASPVEPRTRNVSTLWLIGGFGGRCEAVLCFAKYVVLDLSKTAGDFSLFLIKIHDCYWVLTKSINWHM